MFTTPEEVNGRLDIDEQRLELLESRKSRLADEAVLGFRAGLRRSAGLLHAERPEKPDLPVNRLLRTCEYLHDSFAGGCQIFSRASSFL